MYFFEHSVTAGKTQSRHPGLIIHDEIWQAASRIRQVFGCCFWPFLSLQAYSGCLILHRSTSIRQETKGRKRGNEVRKEIIQRRAKGSGRAML